MCGQKGYISVGTWGGGQRTFCWTCYTTGASASATAGFWNVNPQTPLSAPEGPACPHHEVGLSEAVGLGVDLFTGSWQRWFEKLAQRGYKIVKETK